MKENVAEKVGSASKKIGSSISETVNSIKEDNGKINKAKALELAKSKKKPLLIGTGVFLLIIIFMMSSGGEPSKSEIIDLLVENSDGMIDSEDITVGECKVDKNFDRYYDCEFSATMSFLGRAEGVVGLDYRSDGWVIDYVN
jgi:hypothetical protein